MPCHHTKYQWGGETVPPPASLHPPAQPVSCLLPPIVACFVFACSFLFLFYIRGKEECFSIDRGKRGVNGMFFMSRVCACHVEYRCDIYEVVIDMLVTCIVEREIGTGWGSVPLSSFPKMPMLLKVLPERAVCKAWHALPPPGQAL